MQRVKTDISIHLTSLMEKCQREGSYDDAGFLAIIDQIAENDKDVYLSDMKVLLATASSTLSNGKDVEFTHWYQIFFDVWVSRRYHHDKQFHIFLMTDGDSTNLATMTFLSEWLSDYCGLNVVNSDELCQPGQPLLSALYEICKASSVVFHVQRNKEIDRSTNVLIEAILLDPDFPSELVILKDKSVTLPKVWAKLPVVNLPEKEGGTDNLYISRWISNVFESLLLK